MNGSNAAVRRVVVLLAITTGSRPSHGPSRFPTPQVPDTSFAPVLGEPAFAPGKGPVIMADEAHQNFHTLGGRFQAFGRLVARDGFVTRPGRGRFTTEASASQRTTLRTKRACWGASGAFMSIGLRAGQLAGFLDPEAAHPIGRVNDVRDNVKVFEGLSLVR